MEVMVVGMFEQVVVMVMVMVMVMVGMFEQVAKIWRESQNLLMWHSWFGVSGGNLGAEVEMENNHMFANTIISKAKNQAPAQVVGTLWETG